MYELKNSKQVELSDRVRFRCTRCGDCCRHVEGVVVVESLDAYKLAKHLGITISDFFTDYTEPYYLEDTQYPIFMLKTTGKDKSCIFLKGNRCTVQDVKPRTCRMYPFWIGPGETAEEFTYNFSTERRHHPKGSLVKVKDWMREHFLEEEKRFLIEDSKAMEKIAPLFNELRHSSYDKERLLRQILMLRYFNYETDKPFFEQHKQNNEDLLAILEDEIKTLKSV